MRIGTALLPGIMLALTAPIAAQQPITIPVAYHKLDNGLKVVLSRDKSSPTAVVGVYYNIGFRIELKDRTGFAHLFEHMMFQGSQHLGKNEFILRSRTGCLCRRSTRSSSCTTLHRDRIDVDRSHTPSGDTPPRARSSEGRLCRDTRASKS